MKPPILTTLILAASFLFASCGAPTSANKPITANTTASNTNLASKPAVTAPSKEDLMAAERKAWESWQAKDGKYFEDYLTDNVIAITDKGRIDKATILKRHVDPTCDVKSFSLTEERMIPLGTDAALLTYKATQDAKCGGKILPAGVWAATIVVRSGDQWKAAYHNENAIIDPKALAAMTTGHREMAKQADASAIQPDPITQPMLTTEKAVWEAWKEHDGKKIEELTAKEISFINIFGTFLVTKADAIQNWTSPLCQVKSVSVTDAAGLMLTPTVGILTFKGGADGLCAGQPVPSIWGTSVYLKDGDSWKWTFGMNSAAS